MDRRQRKTRKAIFDAFISLLSERNYDRITVEQILERADVGRATFYAHFETKEYLLTDLCKELFDHIFDGGTGAGKVHTHLFDCEAPDSVFVHLLQHLKKNDNHILDLLSSQNNSLFLDAFQKNLVRLIQSQMSVFAHRKAPDLPEDLWVQHIAATFVTTVRWWLQKGMAESPETITQYFLLAV